MVEHDIPPLEQVREAALRPIGPSGRRFWVLAALLGLLTLWGGVAHAVQLFSGLGAAGYSDRGFWGIYEANLVAFIAISYGGALVSAILRLTHAEWRAPITRLAEAMAVFSLLVGMLFALIHLGRPEQVWRMILMPQISSPIVWDFVVIATYLVSTLVFLYLPLIPDIAVLRDRPSGQQGWRARLYGALACNWRGSSGQRRALERGITAVAILIIPTAVLVHSVLSWAFALTGRPGWHSTIFAPYFVVAALYAGVAMVILVVAGFRKGYHLEPFISLKHFRYLAYLMLTLNLLYLYFTFTELLTEGYVQNEETIPVLESMLVGRYAPYFYLFNLIGGLLPFLLVALPKTRTISGIVVAAGLVVFGMWMKRLLIVVPAVAHPLITGAWGSFQPTWVALGVTVGAAAAIPLLLMLFFKVFPILSIYEIEEVAAEQAHTPSTDTARGNGRAAERRGAASISTMGSFLTPLAVGLAVMAFSSNAVLAQTSDGSPTTLRLTTAPRINEKGRETPGWLVLRAELKTTDGKPVTNQSVSFSQAVDLFGPREAALGEAKTDSTGLAALLYQPAQSGKQTINVSFAGGEGYAPSKTSSAIEVASVVPIFESQEEPLPLAQIRPWLPIGLGGVVAAAWIVLLGVLLSTIRQIRNAPGHPELP